MCETQGSFPQSGSHLQQHLEQLRGSVGGNEGAQALLVQIEKRCMSYFQQGGAQGNQGNGCGHAPPPLRSGPGCGIQQLPYPQPPSPGPGCGHVPIQPPPNDPGCGDGRIHGPIDPSGNLDKADLAELFDRRPPDYGAVTNEDGKSIIELKNGARIEMSRHSIKVFDPKGNPVEIHGDPHISTMGEDGKRGQHIADFKERTTLVFDAGGETYKMTIDTTEGPNGTTYADSVFLRDSTNAWVTTGLHEGTPHTEQVSDNRALTDQLDRDSNDGDVLYEASRVSGDPDNNGWYHVKDGDLVAVKPEEMSFRIGGRTREITRPYQFADKEIQNEVDVFAGNAGPEPRQYHYGQPVNHPPVWGQPIQHAVPTNQADHRSDLRDRVQDHLEDKLKERLEPKLEAKLKAEGDRLLDRLDEALFGDDKKTEEPPAPKQVWV